MRPYALAVSIRKLFATLVALALLFAPVVARAAGASDHEQMMDQTGHCQMPIGGSADHDKVAGKSCCISMCAAVSVGAVAPPQEELVRPACAVSAVPTLHLAFVGEIATPPPRRA